MISYLKLFLDSYPLLYLFLLKTLRIGHWSSSWIVSRQSDLVIEGFPRSANSFAVKAFKENNRSVIVATHVHMSSQVLRSVHLKVPAMVLLRFPFDAVCADLAFSCQLTNSNPSDLTEFSINASLRKYIAFYHRIFPVLDSIFIANFPLVVTDFGLIMASFNEFYGLNYNLFVHDEDSAKRIFSVSQHVGPDDKRNSIKGIVRQRFDASASIRLKQHSLRTYHKILSFKGLKAFL